MSNLDSLVVSFAMWPFPREPRIKAVYSASSAISLIEFESWKR